MLERLAGLVHRRPRRTLLLAAVFATRRSHHPGYSAAFVLDPDGDSAEAVQG